ncbi:hypothetical protein DMENIID0001_107800 [Sergentomyia squamirostris]
MIRVVVFSTILMVLGLQCNCARILLAFPSPSESHLIFASTLMKGLAAQGHNVTVLSHYPLKHPLENYRDVKLSLVGLNKHVERSKSIVKRKYLPLQEVTDVFHEINYHLKLTNHSFHEESWQKVMHEESFDLVIVEMFLNKFLIGLGDHFKCPVVGILSLGTPEVVFYMSGNPSAISTVPSLLLGGVKEMNFIARLEMFLLNTGEKLHWMYQDLLERKYYKANFPSPKYRSYDEMKTNISLFFINEHFSVDYPRPLVPGVVEIGGLNIKINLDPLPQNIQEFMDGAEHGVIFFSLGSIYKSSFLPADKVDVILRVFGKLKQRVLFKWETETPPDKPDNVMMEAWLPQSEILAHKNLQLFVSHGGLGGMNEAKYYGVPVVGIPFVHEQRCILEKAEIDGWARLIELNDLTDEIFSQAVFEVLTHSRYKDAVRQISKLYRDRPLDALQTAIFWIEYVIRHKGAPHLQNYAIQLNFFERNSLDILAFIALVIFIVIKVTIFCVNFCWRNVKKVRRSRRRRFSKDVIIV